MTIKRLVLLALFMLLITSLPARAQERLMDVNDSNQLKTLFNSEKGKVRLVVILSPT